jgi:peptidyl-prolyl cis-trans isomerase C
VNSSRETCISLIIIAIITLVIMMPQVVSSAENDEVLVRIGDKTITKSDLEARVASFPPEYQNRFKSDQQKKEFLGMLVQAKLLAMEARDRKLDQERNMAARIDDAVSGMLAQEYVRQIISGVAKATDGEISKYYDDHKADFKTPAMVKAQHILIKSDANAKPENEKAALAKAKKIKKSLDKGADFAKEAEQNSDDPGSKNKGGDLGFFTKDQMVPEFSKVAFSLKKDKISEPVKSPFGYHIIKVNDTKEEKQMDIKEATPRIKSVIENGRIKEAIDKEIDRLKKKYAVSFTTTDKQK